MCVCVCVCIVQIEMCCECVCACDVVESLLNMRQDRSMQQKICKLLMADRQTTDYKLWTESRETLAECLSVRS